MDLGQDLNSLMRVAYLALDFISHFSKGASFLQLERAKHTQNKVKIFLKD